MAKKTEEKPKVKDLKQRAEQIAAQAGLATEEAVKEFKEKVRAKEKQKIKSDTLVSVDHYLASGIHIGTQRKIKDMKKFIFKVRPDGLSVLDVATIDKRLKIVADFLSKFKPEKIMVVCGRDVGKKPVKKFCELTGAKAVITRFMPGSLTNPSFPDYVEPDLIFVVDPGADKQAVLEALRMNVPIVSLCDTNNMTQNLDLILPVNNKGKKSLALVFWILAREVLKNKGTIKSGDEFKEKIEDFEAEESAEAKARPEQTSRFAQFRGKRRRF